MYLPNTWMKLLYHRSLWPELGRGCLVTKAVRYWYEPGRKHRGSDVRGSAEVK